ncbi:MAG: alpha/beta fold hydrolase [Adlercreutzia equolifaciens]
MCDRAAAIIRLIAQADGAPVLVGYSMGGRIAAETVVRHPDLPLAGLVLKARGWGRPTKRPGPPWPSVTPLGPGGFAKRGRCLHGLVGDAAAVRHAARPSVGGARRHPSRA